MKKNYFEDGSKQYFGNSIIQKPQKSNIKCFNISTEKYIKKNMKVEIVEYEIKN